MSIQANLNQDGPGADPREFLRVAAFSLVVDQRIQREVNPERVARIINEFDWSRFEALTVVDNATGTYTVVEGQNRTLAVQGIDPSLMVPCLILPDGNADEQSQAQLAYEIVKGRAGHSAYEQWQLRLNASHPHEVRATGAMAALGIRLGKAPATTTIGACATVKTIVHGGHHSPEYGAELLTRTLIVLMTAFPTYDHESNVNRWDRDLLLAVSTILHASPEADTDRLAKALRVRPAVQWVNMGRREAERTHEVIRNVITQEYNRGLRRGRL